MDAKPKKRSRRKTLLTIEVADGIKPFLVQVAAQEDKEGFWNLSSILFPQIGIQLKVSPGTSFSGDKLELLKAVQCEFAERMEEQRAGWRNKKNPPREDSEETQDSGESQDSSLPIPVPSPIPVPASNTGERTDFRRVKETFARFWSVYPKKVAKGDAQRAWSAAWKSGAISDANLDAVLAAVRSSSSSKEWTEDGGKFIPYPATWIRGRRWEDETAPAAPTATPTATHLRFV